MYVVYDVWAVKDCYLRVEAYKSSSVYVDSDFSDDCGTGFHHSPVAVRIVHDQPLRDMPMLSAIGSDKIQILPYESLLPFAPEVAPEEYPQGHSWLVERWASIRAACSTAEQALRYVRYHRTLAFDAIEGRHYATPAHADLHVGENSIPRAELDTFLGGVPSRPTESATSALE
jgi:hypothetical protein